MGRSGPQVGQVARLMVHSGGYVDADKPIATWHLELRVHDSHGGFTHLLAWKQRKPKKDRENGEDGQQRTHIFWIWGIYGFCDKCRIIAVINAFWIFKRIGVDSGPI